MNGILAECYVGDAPTDYNSYFDFSPTGLFCVLKRRVAEQLGRCGRHEHPPCAFATHATPAFMFQCRAVLLSHALLFCCTALSGSFILAALTGVTVAALHGIGHNFLHQADNGWMFACIAGGWKVHLNRVSHAISHHPRPNTEWDLEILGLEPWLYNMVSSPENPAAVALYGPLLCASAHLLDILAMWWRLASRRQPTGFRAECLSNAAQLALLVLGNGSFLRGLSCFVVMMLSFGLVDSFAGFPLHHAEQAWTEGDQRHGRKRDFAEHVLASTVDYSLDDEDGIPLGRPSWRSLLLFELMPGHVLHHLFPTVDCSRHDMLRPVLQRTLDDFGVSQQLLPLPYIYFSMWPAWLRNGHSDSAFYRMFSRLSQKRNATRITCSSSRSSSSSSSSSGSTNTKDI